MKDSVGGTGSTDDFVAIVVIPVADGDKARELIEAMAEAGPEMVEYRPVGSVAVA